MPRKTLRLYALVLASSSPRRKELLSELGIPFKIISSNIPENAKPGETPRRLVKRLAIEKAIHIARKMRRKKCLVIGADTVVVLNGKIFGKPGSPRGAAKMLMTLAGKTHRVYTGTAVVDSATLQKAAAVDVSKVKIRKLEYSEALKIGSKHLDKSGSYASQDKHDRLVEKITGNWQTVVGLPINTVKKLIEERRGRWVGVKTKQPAVIPI